MCRAWPARGSRSAGIRCEIRASCRGRGEMGAESGRRRGRGALSLGRGRSGSWALCGVRPASAPAARPEGSAGPWGAPPPPAVLPGLGPLGVRGQWEDGSENPGATPPGGPLLSGKITGDLPSPALQNTWRKRNARESWSPNFLALFLPQSL